jgi:hypothetical protein
MFIPRIPAQSVAVAGTGATAVTTITVDGSFTPASGCVYDILLNAQIPAGTDGTVVAITNGTVDGQVMQLRNGNYARARNLGGVLAIRVQFFADPDHYNLLGVRRAR